MCIRDRVCATQGAYFNRPMAQRFLLELQVFNGTRDTRLALRDGRCDAWLYDDRCVSETGIEQCGRSGVAGLRPCDRWQQGKRAGGGRTDQHVAAGNCSRHIV